MNGCFVQVMIRDLLNLVMIGVKYGMESSSYNVAMAMMKRDGDDVALKQHKSLR